jgi:outer membrane biosynthesis protein TonB
MPIEVPKKKRSLLPLLTVLFLFSYGLMTVLIVEQGAAIQQQRNLIKVLMRDSTELWAAKGKAITDKQMADAQTQDHTQAPSTQEQVPSAKTPSSQTQTPSTQIPSTQAPSTQGVPQHRSQSRAGKVAKPDTQAPPVPASDLVDQRRALHTI